MRQEVRQLYRRLLSKKSIAIILVVVLAACNDEKPAYRAYPVVDTSGNVDVTELGATLTGEILDIGDGVSDHGFVYSRYEIYTDNINNEILSLGAVTGTGKFTALVDRSLENGKTYYYRAFARSRTKGNYTYGQQFTFTSKGGAAPTIKDFFPKQASIDDAIAIIGTGFSRILSNNLARIGDNIAANLDVNGDTLWVSVPTLTPLTEVNVRVEVARQDAQATSKFKLLPITVDSFEPHEVAFGDIVTIHGTNLPVSLKGTYIPILGQSSTFVSSDRSEFKVQVGPAIDTKISAMVPTFGVQKFILEPIKLLPTTIDSFSPDQGAAETMVTIYGSNFFPSIEGNEVWFGDKGSGVRAEIVSATSNQIVVKVPAAASGDPFLTVVAVFQKAFSAGTFHIQN